MQASRARKHLGKLEKPGRRADADGSLLEDMPASKRMDPADAELQRMDPYPTDSDKLEETASSKTRAEAEKRAKQKKFSAFRPAGKSTTKKKSSKTGE